MKVLYLFLIALVGSVAPANAATCGPYKATVEVLSKRFNEHPIFQAIGQTGMLTIFASKAGTWTAVHTNTRKHSCVVDHGQQSEIIRPLTPEL
ncbi:MAG: hypothetical protein GY952_14125 [Rhodobacteraceae bacterium]|nr:hypothetical protein [Paracoccaceae bacterium]